MAPHTNYDIELLDEVLDHLAGAAPEYAGGLSNHGPMATEALVRLGRASAAPSWAERYARRLDFGVDRGRVLAPHERPAAMGSASRYGDWLATFTAVLDGVPWQAAAADALAELLPGVIAAATHCLIRTAHALRALEEADTPARRTELAQALAYWASVYVELPGTPALTGSLGPSAAARTLPLLPDGLRSGSLITDEVMGVAELDGWEASVNRAATPRDVPSALSELTRTFAGWYLAEAEERPIAFVHGVTAPAAARLLLPYVPAPRHGQVFAYAWQACAALRVAIGTTDAPVLPVSPDGVAVELLAERAAASGDEHAIKLTEACIREDRLAPDPVYGAAALDVGERLRA